MCSISVTDFCLRGHAAQMVLQHCAILSESELWKGAICPSRDVTFVAGVHFGCASEVASGSRMVNQLTLRDVCHQVK